MRQGRKLRQEAVAHLQMEPRRRGRWAAGMAGRPAQYVNVTVDDFVHWNLQGLWFRQVYALSADVIVYGGAPS